jgi:hypothetical protein
VTPYREAVTASAPGAGRPQPPDAAAAHEIVIDHRGSFAHAACAACGWRGPGRRALLRAHADGSRHRADLLVAREAMATVEATAVTEPVVGGDRRAPAGPPPTP